ncbi:hypothetical protein BC628DRAFT_357961 [Trametes gibbosa]|nr:hypothetical protein BC628DRAFT_357961 [Trametes gibbosa]
MDNGDYVRRVRPRFFRVSSVHPPPDLILLAEKRGCGTGAFARPATASPRRALRPRRFPASMCGHDARSHGRHPRTSAEIFSGPGERSHNILCVAIDNICARCLDTTSASASAHGQRAECTIHYTPPRSPHGAARCSHSCTHDGTRCGPMSGRRVSVSLSRSADCFRAPYAGNRHGQHDEPGENAIVRTRWSPRATASASCCLATSAPPPGARTRLCRSSPSLYMDFPDGASERASRPATHPSRRRRTASAALPCPMCALVADWRHTI